MEAVVYTSEGKVSRTISLPERVFGARFNADMVHQVVTSMESSARSPIAHTKNRGEVSGGGKKPWKQKGTGRARHGSRRSPIWVGGGVTHGPRNEKNYLRKVNKKMKAAALASLISRKWKDGKVVFVESFEVSGKTKLGIAALRDVAKGAALPELSTRRNNAAYIAFGKKSDSSERGLRNIGSISLTETRSLDPVNVLKYKYLVLVNPDESLAFLSGKVSNRKDAGKEPVAKKLKPVKKTAKAKAKKA